MSFSINTKCDTCSHKEVCSHKGDMIVFTNRIVNLIKNNKDIKVNIGSQNDESNNIFSLPMIECRFFQTDIEPIKTIDGINYPFEGGTITLPYPYPNGGAGTILMNANTGEKSFSYEGSLVETEVYNHTNTSGKPVATSCEAQFMEN